MSDVSIFSIDADTAVIAFALEGSNSSASTADVCTSARRLFWDGEFREHFVHRGRLLAFTGCVERTPAFAWREYASPMSEGRMDDNLARAVADCKHDIIVLLPDDSGHDPQRIAALILRETGHTVRVLGHDGVAVASAGYSQGTRRRGKRRAASGQ